MIVLQGSVEGGRLVLWGEARPEERPKGRKPRAVRPLRTLPSPFDPGPDRLRRAIEEAVGGDGTSFGEAAPVVAWLPTTDEGPVASSPVRFET